MKEIVKSQFTADVVETKMSKKELAEKYELPETEIKKIMRLFGLKASRKRHQTYKIVDDTATAGVAIMAPQDILVESHVN